MSPEKVMGQIEPGMRIFIGTGAAEPRTLVKFLMGSQTPHLKDLELIQLVSLGDAISLEALDSNRYRLKTFFSGWAASEAITAGRVDLIPSRFSEIPELIESGRLVIDAAFVQVTAPDDSGYCSLGIAADVARLAMEQAELVVGEMHAKVPTTFGDTFLHASEFDYLVHATEPPISFQRWPVDDVFDQVAGHVASVVEDGSCIAFSTGPLYEALSRHLTRKRHLGIHSPFFTDPLMDLVKSGAISNRRKEIFRGRSVACYALGTPELLKWLDRNPLVEFQSLDKVFRPMQIGRNPRFVGILPARKVDLSGEVILHIGKGNVTAGPGDVLDLLQGAEISEGGLSVFALPSRNLKGEPNILLSGEKYPNKLNARESVDMIVTEYGVAMLKGRTVRERAQALIEVAHPQDRHELVENAKKRRILYPDQIFLADSAHLYPTEIQARHTFKNSVSVRFRAIKPSDEEEMRRLFYRFSDEAVYYRYFSPIRTMPHARMQKYVNVDYRQVLSIVGLVGEHGQERIIAEARFAKHPRTPHADVAFVVDEAYQGFGIASYLLKMLVRLARERGVHAFTAEVLASNKAMMKVFENSGLAVQAKLQEGVYSLFIPLN